jgi:hypothetical protein
VLRHPSTVLDYPGLLVQVGGSPFDSARPRSTDRIHMACKRSGVRIPLAPQFSVSVFDETVTIFGHWKLSVLSLIRAFMGARMRCMHEAGRSNRASHQTRSCSCRMRKRAAVMTAG